MKHHDPVSRLRADLATPSLSLLAMAAFLLGWPDAITGAITLLLFAHLCMPEEDRRRMRRARLRWRRRLERVRRRAVPRA